MVALKNLIRLHVLFSFLFVLGMTGAFWNPVLAQNERQPAIVKGQVTNQNQEPLHLVHVMIKRATTGDVSNQNGRFAFESDTSGSVTIIASMVGYESIEKENFLHPENTAELYLTMKVKNSTLGEATVTAGAFTTGEGEGVTLSPVEVVTTGCSC